MCPARFRCHCGHVIVIHQPKGRDAQVVRCPSCGAARAENATQCPYCQSEFTLFDRDLNTVCPHCLARVSDHARFCHHCGTAITPELDAGAESKMLCPACQDGHHLVHRDLGMDHGAVLECGRCAGFWMGHELFRNLVEHAQLEAVPDGTIPETPLQVAARFGLPHGSVAPENEEHGSFYRPCPVCRELMSRRNYGHYSGVIIDICKDHGLWFDAEELARILAWLRAGGGRKPAEEIPLFQSPEAARLLHQSASTHPHSFLNELLGALMGDARGRW